jgi:hypothetical protein
VEGAKAIVRAASLDPSLRAVITSRRAVHYALGSDIAEDRPAHVRAASSLAWIDGRIALVQDDANFVALIDTEGADAHVIALPRGVGGVRLFDDARGNKKFKLDLEACVAVRGARGPTLLAFGSGSKKRRRQVVAIDRFLRVPPRVRLTDATALYERLEAETGFAGSDMNIEGAVVIGRYVRFFGRGNGKARGGLQPLNATCDVSLKVLLAYLNDPEHKRPPKPRNVVEYALGDVDGIPLGFTDATLRGTDIVYSATAEASEDAAVDGPVTGSVLGVIDSYGRVRYTPITDHTGAALREKVEGLLLRDAPGRAYVVIDPDDHFRPSELCEVELSGDWSDGLR